MKTFFNEHERYSEEGDSLSIEVYDELRPIFEKWINFGYKAREIEYIMTKVCTDLALDEILDLN